MFNDIVFESNSPPTVDELLDFYARQRNSFAANRTKVRELIENTFCFVTARRHDELIGFARGVIAGTWGRLAECKLDPAYQGPACLTRTDGRVEHDEAGIAREMARRVVDVLRLQGADRIEALAHGTEVDFCEELGFRRMRGLVALELPAGVNIAAANSTPILETTNTTVNA
ncbi:MAG: hypothetical protein HY287_09105 [Planctomycetes bacterium]|nr:hypothetical protein [Planctomycetota bacterium]MBI3834470.1 hypothetical protein [Planctomycetota bacterium]